MRGHHGAFTLHLGGQLVPQLQRRAPFVLLLVYPGQSLQHGSPVTGRAHQAAQLFLGPIHESGAEIVQAERERGLFADRQLAMLAEFGVDGDRPIHLAAAAHETAQCELDVGLVGFVGEAGEDFRGAVVTIVDQVIEAGEVIHVPAHAATARRTPAEQECGRPHHEKTKQQNFRADTAQTHARTLAELPGQELRVALRARCQSCQ
jgi:hypothetical protein